MDFHFVDGSCIGSKDRKLIRSHVMKGKNAGRVLKRRKQRPDLLNPCHIGEHPVHKEHPDRQDDGGSIHAPHLHRPVGNEMITLSFPDAIPPDSWQSLHQWMRTTKSRTQFIDTCIPLQHTESLWFERIQSDKLMLHCILAICEAMNDRCYARAEPSQKTTWHYLNTYRCIGQRLEGVEAPSDTIIAAVTALSLHADLQCQQPGEGIHLKALGRMVALRGGLSRFEDNKFLMRKMCRADIEHAIVGDTMPFFYRDRFPYDTVHSLVGLGEPPCLLPLRHTIATDSAALSQIMLDLDAVCHLLNDDYSRLKLDHLDFQEMFFSLCYRLLYSNSTRRSPAANKARDETLRSALLAFMTTMLSQCDDVNAQKYIRVAEKLHHSLDTMMDEPDCTDDVWLWLLFVGGISVFGSNENSWLVSHIKHCLFTLSIDSWDEAQQLLHKFPWISEIHDQPARKLWKAVLWC